MDWKCQWDVSTTKDSLLQKENLNKALSLVFGEKYCSNVESSNYVIGNCDEELNKAKDLFGVLVEEELLKVSSLLKETQLVVEECMATSVSVEPRNPHSQLKACLEKVVPNNVSWEEKSNRNWVLSSNVVFNDFKVSFRTESSVDFKCVLRPGENWSINKEAMNTVSTLVVKYLKKR